MSISYVTVLQPLILLVKEKMENLSNTCPQISEADINWLRRLYNKKITGILCIELERRSNIIARNNPWYKAVKEQ